MQEPHRIDRRDEDPAAGPAPRRAGARRGQAALRSALEALYRTAGVAAGLSLVATLAAVLLGIFSRLFGVYVPGTEDYAGYSMAASGFLALGYTFKHGEHIRVSLVLERLTGRRRRATEIVALAVATVAAAIFAWYSVRLCLDSHEFNDVSQGVDATPLWIPQLGMAAGAVVLLVAVLDDLVVTLSGRDPVRLKKRGAEPTRAE
jgi:TRAP-type C4-dicarboxylate transport system permease small subunit